MKEELGLPLEEGTSKESPQKNSFLKEESKGDDHSDTLFSGFSNLSKREKMDFVLEKTFGAHSSYAKKEAEKIMESFWHRDSAIQKILDEFSENTLTNYVLPFGVLPHALINGRLYNIPMAIEESSVVAAASKAAKFWLSRGGFHAEVKGVKKSGQVHFKWKGDGEKLEKIFTSHCQELLESLDPLQEKMKERGGGVLGLKFLDKTSEKADLYQIWVDFETCDAMGANFINTILEAVGRKWKSLVAQELPHEGDDLQIIMAILSNYTPECLVRAWVQCPLSQLVEGDSSDPLLFAQKFKDAVDIALFDTNRAVTHNKGIMNGIDSVVLATGNDFRAVEACAHAYASRGGQYQSLTKCSLDEGIFSFEIEIPLALGTVGGLTSLHPLAHFALDMLGRPSARDLMQVVAVTGLAQNFAAIRGLVTTGIQKGHMKMHLINILNTLQATEEERERAKERFSQEVISFQGVSEFIKELRSFQ